jgi:hypothetical protein
MLAQLENTKMVKFLPKGSLRFGAVSIVKALNLFVLMKTMCQVCLILHRREAPQIGRNNWPKKECNLQDLEGVFLAKGCVMTSNPREVILDNIIGMIVST